MFSFFCPLLFVLGICLFNSIIFKEKFERVIVFSLLEVITITFFFGFIDMRVGLIISIIIAGMSLPLLYCAQKCKYYRVEELFCTDMFWSFVGLFTVIFVWNVGKGFCRWDEFSHWGMMAKEMFRLDHYYYLEESVLEYHKEYPPFTTILQYIWCKLCGEYKERHLYSAKIILSLATFFPVYSWIFDEENKKESRITRVVKIFIVPILFIVISNMMSMGEALYYRTIYTEGVLCALIFYAFFSLMNPFTSRWLNVLNLTLTLTALVLTKQMGIYFYVLVVCGYILLKLLKGEIKESIGEIFSIGGVPLGCNLLWSKVTSLYVERGQFDASRFSIDELIALAKGQGLEYQYITIENMLDAIVNYPLMSKPINLSYIAIVVSFVAVTIIFYNCNKERVDLKEFFVLNMGFIVGAVGYIFVMLILYFFGFSEGESMGLVCYERYMSAMMFPMVMIGCMYLVNIVIKKVRLNEGVLLSIITVSILLGGVSKEILIENITPGILCDNITDVFIGDATIINEHTKEDDKIFIICQGDIGGDRNIIAYLSSPRKFNMAYFTVDEDDKDAMLDVIIDYDYLFLSNVDEIFMDAYGELFEEESVKNQQLYLINKGNSKNIFERIY